MTERALSLTTQIATPIQLATFNSTAPVSASDAQQKQAVESADEEPYTIKCICDYSDDDGNTIWCDTCATWQHIECFYPGRVDEASREEFAHSCADCKPRQLELDRRTATERQRRQRQDKANNDNSDKKSKRPPAKSHKKKLKPAELQANGYHDYDGHKSPQEQHQHTKKTKGHRPSQSVSSIKRTPPFTARPHNTHPPSPAHTPPDLPENFQVHGYSDIFRSSYDHQTSSVETATINNFAGIPVLKSMSDWLSNPATLLSETGIKPEEKKTVFQYFKPGFTLDSLKWPSLHVETRNTIVDGEQIRWRQLHISTASTGDSTVLGEIIGFVSYQMEYCNNVENRWKDAPHPKPFVFFPPRIPLAIDTRQEGTQCRFIRRSCRSNTKLETFILNDSEYHFLLVSDRPLAANEQLTIPWEFKVADELRGFLPSPLEEDGASSDLADMTEEQYEQLSQIIHIVLSDHGGCACDLGNDCAFARFHRDFQGRLHTQTSGTKAKKGRKPKNHVSPTSTGHATNSRAASEGQQEQFDEDDGRSISGSIRSKPRSRDLTPSHPESNGILTEPSDREKRKLAMLEDSFRKMEQGQPPRKKKRASDGATVTATAALPSHPAPKQRKGSIVPRGSVSHASQSHTNGARPRNYQDASTSGRQSGSPSVAHSPKSTVPTLKNPTPRTVSEAHRSRQPSVAVKSVYVDKGIQTDDGENPWWKVPTRKAKRVLPLAAKLLRNRHRIQLQQDMNVQQEMVVKDVEDKKGQTSPGGLMDIDVPTHDAESPTSTKDRNASVSSSSPSVDNSTNSVDVIMIDAPAINVGCTIKPPPPPWPSPAHGASSVPKLPASHSPGLQVQMPPTPTFSTTTLSGTSSSAITASPGTASFAQSPFGSQPFPGTFVPSGGTIAAPSPVKMPKKLSLSDYKAARLKKNTAGLSKSSDSSPTGAPPVLKPALATIEESKTQGAPEEPAVIETPLVEKPLDPISSKTGLGTELALKN
jgi:hypothetical protein